ncbi:MAG: ABC transporter ATP-binding protein [Dictyoglomus sp.]|nr:ABC transporter ATP-binding protein [Dictyoglomus sp.]MCX7942448.1 ABC transporter ATP-binding protein [Dictyoglomaceae bacterium]
MYALREVDLFIPEGKTLCIIGPSGCGKTTLLKVIAGLEKPDSGNIYFNEQLVNDLPPKDRGVGMVFQNYALYPHYKARGNLSFYFWIRKRPEKEIDERIRETAKILGVGFEELLPRKPKTLSGGEQQRVAIGRCIVRNPTLMLMDEPLSNLDAKLRVITRTEIKKLLVRFQVTTVYVTHDQREAQALGDIIAVMKQGRILQVGTYEDLIEEPKDAFTASFVGVPPMNLIKGEVINNKFVFNNLEIPIPFKYNKKEIILGFHPSKIEISKNPTNLIGEIFFIESLPSDKFQILHIEIGKLNLKIQIPRENAFRIGDKVYLNLPQKIYFFDPDNEKRIV